VFCRVFEGSIALACAVLGAAARMDLFDDLKRQWARSGSSLPELEREISHAAPKAWRFTGEMNEIGAAFAGWKDSKVLRSPVCRTYSLHY
jgi:hypothetical protein